MSFYAVLPFGECTPVGHQLHLYQPKN